jgi:ABC-type amino acid transport substrate-binding protein
MKIEKCKPLFLLCSLLVFSIVFSACRGRGSSGTPANAAPDQAQLQEIAIGGCGYPTPYQWLDDNGHLQGYDIAVAEEVARRSGLRLHWENTEFPALFLGLDANRYQTIVGNISYTEERAEKYTFPNEYYCRLGVHIVVAKGRGQGITGIDDLAGKRVPILANGSTNFLYLMDYNETHPNAPINLIFTDDPGASNLTGLSSGLYDAVISTEIAVQQVVKETGLEFDIIYLPEDTSEAIMPAKAYYVFTKDSAGINLASKFDTALEEMIEDGTLSALSIEYFGVDLSR